MQLFSCHQTNNNNVFYIRDQCYNYFLCSNRTSRATKPFPSRFFFLIGIYSDQCFFPSFLFPHPGKTCNESALMYVPNDMSNDTCVNWNQYYTDCRPGDKNPFQGAISFDNIGLAWVAIFLVSEPFFIYLCIHLITNAICSAECLYL